MTREEFLVEYENYQQKKKELEDNFESVKKRFIEESGIKVGDIGVLKSTGEEVKISDICVSTFYGRVAVSKVYKKNKNGEFTKRDTCPYDITIVNGKEFDWM